MIPFFIDLNRTPQEQEQEFAQFEVAQNLLSLADEVAVCEIVAIKTRRPSPYQDRDGQWILKFNKIRREVVTTGRVSTKHEYYRWLHNELRKLRNQDTEETRWKSKMLLSIGIDYTVVK